MRDPPKATPTPLQFSNSSVAHHRHRQRKAFCVFRPLLRTDLKDSPGFLLDFDDLLTFSNGQGQWLFTIDILTCQHGVNGDLSVPVIDGGDADDVDVSIV